MSRTAQAARCLSASFEAIRPIYQPVINLADLSLCAIALAGIRDRAGDRTVNLATLQADYAREQVVAAFESIGMTPDILRALVNEVL